MSVYGVFNSRIVEAYQYSIQYILHNKNVFFETQIRYRQTLLKTLNDFLFFLQQNPQCAGLYVIWPLLVILTSFLISHFALAL